MLVVGENELLNMARGRLSEASPSMDESFLQQFVNACLACRQTFLRLAREHGSPLYALDAEALRGRFRRFRRAFDDRLDNVEVYYALKSNNMPEISALLVEEGAGLDASSGLELEQALAAGADKILFSGPGKTRAELQLALENREQVTILIDSFGELERLDRLTRQSQRPIRAGVRLTTQPDGLWRKFGIPISQLATFFRYARQTPFVKLEGLQFHTSWNRRPDVQTAFIDTLGRALCTLSVDDLDAIRFLDIGGGYWPEEGEWLRAAGTPAGALRNLLAPEGSDTTSKFQLASCSIDVFARQIGEALRSAIPGGRPWRICLEPGRWLSHAALHLLLTVVDVKARDLVITDGGTNAVGWERFEHDYFPVVNLTRPGLDEKHCNILGSLCTPNDVWGYAYHGSTICPDDILLIPFQGAYTYSLRQQFIKPLPSVARLPEGLSLAWPNPPASE